MEGVPPVDLLGSRPPGRESSTCKGERGNLLPPLARAGRLLQRRGDKQYTNVLFSPDILIFTQAPTLICFHSTISDISTILVTMYYSRYVRL